MLCSSFAVVVVGVDPPLAGMLPPFGGFVVAVVVAVAAAVDAGGVAEDTVGVGVVRVTAEAAIDAFSATDITEAVEVEPEAINEQTALCADEAANEAVDEVREDGAENFSEFVVGRRDRMVAKFSL